MSVDFFGRYQSQTTKQLAQIQSTKYPDTNKDMEANLRRLNQFVDYIAQYLQVMQKGVDQANEDSFARLKNMAADMTVLFGGGELLYGINLGDLQYFLPAIGAIFGFDANKPFPISLLEMAEHFFLGYVVPLDSFVFEIQDIIDGWLTAMGIDQPTVDAIHGLLDAIASVTSDSLTLFNNLWDVLNAFGINTDGFGPFADIWHSVTQLLGAFNLQTLGALVDPVLHALAPWITELAQAVNELDSIIRAFSGGLTDVQGVVNFAGLFTPFTDLMATAFDPLTAWSDVITGALNPLGLITSVLDPNAPLNALNLYGLIPDNLLGLVPFSHIGSAQPNLLTAGPFDDPANVQGGGIWLHDATVGHTTLGSVYTTATGSLKELLSNAIPVTEGQQLDLSAWAKWSGLTYTGTPIKLQVAKFLNYTNIGVDDIASPAAPATNQATWVQLTGPYTVPAGVDMICLQFAISNTASAGTIWFDDAIAKKTGMLQIPWVEDLPTQLSDLVASVQDTLNSIWQGIFGAAPVGNVLLADVINALQLIPAVNVLGLHGGTIADTLEEHVNTLWSGFAQLFGATGKSITDVASKASDTVSLVNTSIGVGEWNSALLGVRNNKSLMEGMDETTESNFLLSDLFSNGADPIGIVSATSTSYPVAYWRAKELAHKGVITWFGKGFANITALYIDIYKLNFTTNQSELLLSSTDQIGQVTASWGLCRWTIPTASRFDVTNGDVIGVSWRVVGTGTHSIAGKLAGSWLPADTAVTPQKPASTRTSTANVAFGSIAYSNNVPWFGIGIASGDAPVDYHAPRTTQISAAGAYSYSVPDWANFVDEIKVGGGGGGEGGDTITAQRGQGGFAGAWDARTLVRGTDFGSGTGITLTGTIGSGGAHGAAAGVNGGAGTATTRNSISGGAAASSAAGGAGGGVTGFGTPHVGGSPGIETFNGVDYPGGNGGSASGSTGGDGQAPGAGGGGGQGGTWGVAWAGGDGARGGAWFVARQT